MTCATTGSKRIPLGRGGILEADHDRRVAGQIRGGQRKVPGASRTQAVLEAETALLHFSSLSTFLGEFLGVPAAGKTFWPMFRYLIKIPLRKMNWSQG